MPTCRSLFPPVALLIAALAPQAPAQVPTPVPVPVPSSAGAAKVVVQGAVPDEASKAALLARLRELYGAERVVDQLAVASVAMPANWHGYVQKLIQPNLKLVSKGELRIEGNNVSLRGEVANEAQRQQLASDMAASLNPTYTFSNGLRVHAAEQSLLDATLARRIIEFESGKAALADSGKHILDEMALALLKVNGKMVEVIGHTDNVGVRERNLALSLARAEAVRAYLGEKGIPQAQIQVAGQGPDRPVADNGSADGRARNRRIEFRVMP
ncbi:OmpA family protein [Duganella qianjiadongensis]|uniref:OmpA family protein n=1 Tax=Duganella qianjiadongensis TaxID=2692176 RepID=A0ABW9VSF8_9BURK|nr:OmpA family protein [Duganella qianjiadongensis]MYM41858.1 OmpA family protein [Duganella qianjiadongensis]